MLFAQPRTFEVDVNHEIQQKPEVMETLSSSFFRPEQVFLEVLVRPWSTMKENSRRADGKKDSVYNHMWYCFF